MRLDWRTGRWLLTGLGLLTLALVAFGIIPYDLHPNDSHAYWAVNPTDPYREARVGQTDAFLYAPVVAQLIAPLTALPFETFRLVWGAVSLGALALAGAAFTLVVPGVIEDLVRGNIHILLAVAVLAGFRYPGTWAAILLTKVTPGIGLIWFAVRREWQALGWVALTTVLLVAASVLVGGGALWGEWIRVLLTAADAQRTYTYLGIAPPPLLVRLPLAAAVAAWAGLTSRRWAVPVAAFLALPVIWPSGFALLAAVPPLWLADRPPRGAATDSEPAGRTVPGPARRR
jgi:hypothetical protein